MKTIFGFLAVLLLASCSTVDLSSEVARAKNDWELASGCFLPPVEIAVSEKFIFPDASYSHWVITDPNAALTGHLIYPPSVYIALSKNQRRAAFQRALYEFVTGHMFLAPDIEFEINLNRVKSLKRALHCS